MKFGAILTLFLVIVSLFGHHTHGQGEAKLCRETMELAGKCGSRGGYECAIEFLGKYGASAMPQHCTCKDAAQQRQCQCSIICG